MKKRLSIIIFLSFYISAFSANVTFRVDMKSQIVNNEGVFVAGLFNGWDDSNDKLTDDDHDGVYEITKSIAAGNYDYKFKNGLAGWETINYSRNLSVNNADVVLPVICFNDDCSLLINITSTSNSAVLSWQFNSPIDIKFNGIEYTNISTSPFVFTNLGSCKFYQADIKLSSVATYKTYYFNTTSETLLPATVPYNLIGSSQSVGVQGPENGFCGTGWTHNTDFQWFQYDGKYYDVTLGRSSSSPYLSTVRSSVTSREIRLTANQKVYIKYRPSIYSNTSNAVGSLKTSIGTSTDIGSQMIINAIDFSQIPPYTTPASQAQIIIPFTPSESGSYYISLYSDDIPVFANEQSVFLHNYEFMVTDNLLNVENINKPETLKIYPNPVKNSLNVLTQDKLQKLEIYSVSGQLVQTSFLKETNVEALSKGNYVIRITTDNGVQTEKIIKE